MATEQTLPVVTIGGKGSTLSSSTLHSIANSLSQVRIDSSRLEKLSPSLPLSTKPLNPSPNPKTLTLEQSRASLTTLLSKLISSPTQVRSVLPNLITQTLARNFDPSQLDFGSAFGFLDSFLRLNGQTVEETGVTEGELVVLENSFFQFYSIGALVEFESSDLSTVADVVAALSCKAAKADVSGAVSFTDSGDGLSVKEVANVASDLKVFLVGSKLGKVESGYFTEIPKVNGGLRKVAKAVHVEVRVELNSSVKAGKLVSEGSSGVLGGFAAGLSCLGASLWELGKSSLGRGKLVIDLIPDEKKRVEVTEVFEGSCVGFEGLKNRFQKAQLALIDSDYLGFLQEICSLLGSVRDVVAWEGALALAVLEVNESVGKKGKGGDIASSSQGKENGRDRKADFKSDKKNKKGVKGIGVLEELLKERLTSEGGSSVENWARDLSAFFNPKDSRLQEFLEKVKEVAETNESRRLPKLPKGTRDFAKEQMVIREKAFSTIQKVFKKHGGAALDTPVFEMRETLMGKYGEDSKLIYDLADQGGELCSLRYDLTVPLARYVAMNGLTSFNRYQIAKVYRRDNPSKGRYREFYQCDFDIAGQYELMGPDFHVIKILTELLDELDIGDYEIKLNHRKLLDGMLEICGVSPEKFRTICSSIDKLDKQSFEEIKKEMVEEKGLTVETADKIGSLVKKRGHPLEILSELKQDGSQFLTNKGSVLALNELEILFKSLEKSKCIDRVVFDLSLARGLDYYTGVIYEAIFKGATQVGSIAAGGRYDNLIGMFGSKQVPAVGISLGIERILTILEEQLSKNQVIRVSETEVLVGILGDDLPRAAELASELWNADVKAEFIVHKKILKLIERASESGIPWMVIEGEKEQNEGDVILKNMQIRKEVSVPRNKFVEELQKCLSGTSSHFC